MTRSKIQELSRIDRDLEAMEYILSVANGERGDLAEDAMGDFGVDYEISEYGASSHGDVNVSLECFRETIKFGIARLRDKLRDLGVSIDDTARPALQDRE